MNSRKEEWRNKPADGLAKREKIKKNPHRSTSKSSSSSHPPLEYPEAQWSELLAQDYFAARVVEVHKGYAFVATEASPLAIKTHDVWLGAIAGKFTQKIRQERNFFAVGDRVLCRPSRQTPSQQDSDPQLPTCAIEHRAPRQNTIHRQDPMVSSRHHVLATNLSQLCIVASYTAPQVKWGLIDRYLVLAESQGLKALILLNKRDLLAQASPAFVAECETRLQLYKDLGYEVASLSTTRGLPTTRKWLHKHLAQAVSLFSGHSGVGKSSLINLLHPEINQAVETEAIAKKGRHTTTYASLLKLKRGGFVIDTPGIRSLSIPSPLPARLDWCFREFRSYLNQCKYRECRHHHEPGCAIRQAVEAEAITTWRYASYLAMLTGASGRQGRKESSKP